MTRLDENSFGMGRTVMGKEFSLVHWKRVFKCKEFGGLEIINLGTSTMPYCSNGGESYSKSPSVSGHLSSPTSSEAWTCSNQERVHARHVADTDTCPTRVGHVLTVPNMSQRV